LPNCCTTPQAHNFFIFFNNSLFENIKTFRKKLLGKASAKKPLRKASSKAQSAMEYLMTYGWAILIISVVLAALFQLGVFNPMTFAPKAPPGSCQVFRPNGPGTTSFINLEGICSGELPQYVAQFNGQNSYIKTGTNDIPTGSPTVSITAWVNVPIYTASGCGQEMTFGYGNFSSGCNANGVGLGLNGNGYVSFASCGNDYFSPFQVTRNTWTFIAAVYTSGATTVTVYENNNSATGSLSSNKQISIQTPITSWIGAWPSPGCLFDDSIANVQIYNTSLSANEIQALYLEGIGGAPIDLQHLVAWWPLNGNANDYSGNGNNGQINNVTFASTGIVAIRHHNLFL